MKKFLFLLLSGFVFCIESFAALTSGYYKIYNSGYQRYMYEDFTSNTICTTTSCADTDYEKIWYITVNGSTVTLKNAYTGNYAQTQSTTSAQFTTGSTKTNFTLTTNSDGTYMFSSGSYMHCAASQSYYIVNWWDSSSAYSMWTVESVTVDETALAAAQAEYTAVAAINTNASTYNTSLLTFFTDASCSELKSTYKNYSDANLKTAMANKSLPTALQNIAVKVKNSWSDETNSSVAGTFRVREYQAYSQAWYWRSNLNATQFTDMNNPTGIYANAKDAIYIFVGGTIPDNCKLRVVGITGSNQMTFAAGTELKAGLNALQASADLSHLWIMYSTSSTDVDLSTLAKLKIHIEGGNVYGFADVTGMDETAANAAYKTALTAANTMCDAKSTSTSDICFVVKGNRGLFYFPLDTYNEIWQTTAYGSYSYTTNYNIYKSIHWFDNVLAWEWGLMGFTKRVYDGQTDTNEHVTGGKSIYPTYCNNLALTLQGSGNPYSTTGYTSMPGVSGVESSYNAERADFDNWCVGHESGHNNQGAINLPSSTESSNNLFSNVVTYLHGYRMSRGESVSTTNSDYQSGTQFALRDIGSTHRMYWQLYLYYHEAQHKTSFYPELFESLRNDPMDLSTGECFLKFYQKACDAAGEDLTEFFRGWGFFVPFENTTFGDYTTRVLTLTQDQIDAAIASVKAKYSTENTSIMFIEDRINSSYRWDAWADGTEDVRPVQDYAVGQCGDIGSVTDYSTTASTATAANYTSYTLSGNTITMNGTGGVGFLVYDASGTLVAFSNSKSFTIPSDAIAAGFTVKVVNADNTSAEVKNVSESGADADKLAALKAVIAAANKIINVSDVTETKVGYYKGSAVTTLSELVTEANTVVSTSATAQYGEMINSLNEEIANLNTKTDTKIEIESGKTYTIKNNFYPTRYMTAETSQIACNTAMTSGDTQKWKFISTGTDGEYYIQSVSTSNYISTLGTSTHATMGATTTDDAFKFTIEEKDSAGVFALNTHASEGYTYLHSASNDGYYVVGWTGGSDASKWNIYLVVDDDMVTDKSTELADLIAKCETLLPQAGVESAITLTASNLSTNHQETSEGPIAQAIDDNTSTIFHSTWSQDTSDKHYFQVDLGDGNAVDLFSFTMTSRNSNPNNFPSDITVQGSNNGTDFTDIVELTNSLSTSEQVIYESDTVGTAGTSYRYIRFVVNKTGSGNGNNSHTHAYDFFSLAEFSMTRLYDAALFAYIDSNAKTGLSNETDKAKTILAANSYADMCAEISVLKSYYDKLYVLVNEDVNKDGKVNIADIPTLVKFLKDKTTTTRGDVDGDGSITLKDVPVLKNIILKK